MMIHCDEAMYDVLIGEGKVYSLVKHPGALGFFVASTQFGAVNAADLTAEAVMRGFRVVTDVSGATGSVRFEAGPVRKCRHCGNVLNPSPG